MKELCVTYVTYMRSDTSVVFLPGNGQSVSHAEGGVDHNANQVEGKQVGRVLVPGDREHRRASFYVTLRGEDFETIKVVIAADRAFGSENTKHIVQTVQELSRGIQNEDLFFAIISGSRNVPDHDYAVARADAGLGPGEPIKTIKWISIGYLEQVTSFVTRKGSNVLVPSTFSKPPGRRKAWSAYAPQKTFNVSDLRKIFDAAQKKADDQDDEMKKKTPGKFEKFHFLGRPKDKSLVASGSEKDAALKPTTDSDETARQRSNFATAMAFFKH